MLHTSAAISQNLQNCLGGSPTLDADGDTPVYIASAYVGRSVQPCKFVLGLQAPNAQIGVRVPYNGEELEYKGNFDLLPFDPYCMEWVPTSRGKLPHNRILIDGGFEEDGRPLYHAMGKVDGVPVPGKTGEHLGGCHIPFGCSEIIVKDDYDILCWKSSSCLGGYSDHGHSSQHVEATGTETDFDSQNYSEPGSETA